ncbi:MAG: LysR family transcriptional regulator [Pseudomonadota bacterium]
MERSRLSLKWLEAFQAVARYGTVSEGAQSLGVSVSTVSHHLTCLERELGTQLLDHGKRPMRLTAAGEILLRRVDEALWLLQKGASEIWAEDLQSFVRPLRIALIADFDTDVGPALVGDLARKLPHCDFSVLSRPTHEVIDLLESEEIDIGLASSADRDWIGIYEEPVLRDPFILVIPADMQDRPSDLTSLLAQNARLPLLRYSRKLLLGRRIEAQLQRLKLNFADRMEFESTHVILSTVAAGRGWTITSALTYARAQRYHAQLHAMTFPGKAFSRQISLFHRENLPNGLHDLLLKSVRNSVQTLVIEPLLERHSWLEGQFRLIEQSQEEDALEEVDIGATVSP